MRVTKASVRRVCAVCDRSLLQGEIALRFSPTASSSSTSVRSARISRSTTAGCGRAARSRRRSHPAGAEEADTLVAVPRRPERGRAAGRPRARAPAAHRLGGGARRGRRSLQREPLPPHDRGRREALGAPLVSIVPLSGVNSELVLTFAWEITWYQYRVLPEAGQPIRLADRGADLSEIEAAFTEWNGSVDDAGRVVPNVAR